jgi:aspartate oxidase
VHPTSLVDPKDPTNLTKFLGPETMRGEGGILVDANGKRCVNSIAYMC